jgi:hypothetical protein
MHDWRLGAEWFESMLIDHDVCSNYGVFGERPEDHRLNYGLKVSPRLRKHVFSF